jgi:3-phosphoglycerate kinase
VEGGRDQWMNIYVGQTLFLFMDFYTLDDFDVKDKTVFVRVDINSPLDPDTLAILDTSRIHSVVPTIKELCKKKAKTVILAHQGRPGSWDFKEYLEHPSAMSMISMARKPKQKLGNYSPEVSFFLEMYANIPRR